MVQPYCLVDCSTCTYTFTGRLHSHGIVGQTLHEVLLGAHDSASTSTYINFSVKITAKANK